MIPRTHIKIEEKPVIKAGTILLARPFLERQEFQRTVILLIHHHDDLTWGIILNQPSTLYLNKIVPTAGFESPIYYGGPDLSRSVNYIHNFRGLPESFDLGNGLSLGGNKYYLDLLLRSGLLDSNAIRFFAGIVSWKAGQLETEFQNNSWWVDEINDNELLSIPSGYLWSYKVLSLGHVYGLMQSCPDPFTN